MAVVVTLHLYTIFNAFLLFWWFRNQEQFAQLTESLYDSTFYDDNFVPDEGEILESM